MQMILIVLTRQRSAINRIDTYRTIHPPNTYGVNFGEKNAFRKRVNSDRFNAFRICENELSCFYESSLKKVWQRNRLEPSSLTISPVVSPECQIYLINSSLKLHPGFWTRELTHRKQIHLPLDQISLNILCIDLYVILMNSKGDWWT